jgi:hypothetical protein
VKPVPAVGAVVATSELPSATINAPEPSNIAGLESESAVVTVERLMFPADTMPGEVPVLPTSTTTRAIH